MSKPRPLSRRARHVAVLVAAGWAVAASAQSMADSDAPPPAPGQVLSDVQPLPAEDRDSHGALLMDGREVRAQKQQQKQPPAAAIGRDAHSVVERTRSWNEVDATAEEDQSPRGEASGAGPR